MSSNLNLYDVAIPPITKRIVQLSHCLKKAEQWAKDNNQPLSTLVEARVYDDMHPLPFQVQTCYRMTIILLSQLKFIEMPPKMPEVGRSFDDMYKKIDEMMELLGKTKREEFDGKAEEEIRFPPGGGPDSWIFTGLSFVQEFILPNRKSVFYLMVYSLFGRRKIRNADIRGQISSTRRLRTIFYG
jgi:hypothetical protein